MTIIDILIKVFSCFFLQLSTKFFFPIIRNFFGSFIFLSINLCETCQLLIYINEPRSKVFRKSPIILNFGKYWTPDNCLIFLWHINLILWGVSIQYRCCWLIQFWKSSNHIGWIRWCHSITYTYSSISTLLRFDIMIILNLTENVVVATLKWNNPLLWR